MAERKEGGHTWLTLQVYTFNPQKSRKRNLKPQELNLFKLRSHELKFYTTNLNARCTGGKKIRTDGEVDSPFQ